LTGGSDSRMVLAAVTQVGVRPMADTNGDVDDADVRLARRVAAAGAVPWKHIRLDPDWAADGANVVRSAAWADGALDAIALARVLYQHELKIPFSRHVVTGGGGEHFNSFPWLQEFLRAGRSRSVNYDALLNMRYLKHVPTQVLAQDPDPPVREYFREHLSRRADRYADAPNTTKLDAIYAYKSVGHFGAFRSAGEACVRAEIPCYYREIFEAAFSAHHRWRNNHRLQRRIIARLQPALAAVPTTRGGSAEPIAIRNVHQLVPYYASVAQRAGRKLATRGKPAHAAAPGATASERYARTTGALRERGVLDPAEMCSGELYDRGALESLLTRSAKEDFAEWTLMGRVATVELALRLASGEESNVTPSEGQATRLVP
jgi:hypothetical protein